MMNTSRGLLIENSPTAFFIGARVVGVSRCLLDPAHTYSIKTNDDETIDVNEDDETN